MGEAEVGDVGRAAEGGSGGLVDALSVGLSRVTEVDAVDGRRTADVGRGTEMPEEHRTTGAGEKPKGDG